MARLCEVCRKEYANDMRYGVQVCQHCLDLYGKAISGDTEAMSYFGDSKNFPTATEAARRNLINVIVNKCKKAGVDSGEQFVKSQREQEREDYARSLGVTLEDDTGVGRTIKNWAMGIFVFEVVCAVIYGFLMLFTGNVVGLLIVAAGVVLARGSYWVLYAFGELVEKTSANEQNTRNILKVLLDEKKE